MLNSIYSASAGMQVNMSRLDIIANNTANMDSPGFKKAIGVTSSFTKLMSRTLNGKPAPDQEIIGTYMNEIKTDFSDGSLLFTGSDKDMMINGTGFFTIQTPDGVAYTRNGSFSTNGDGILVTQNGNPVLGSNGPIKTGGYKDISVSDTGMVSGDGKDLDSLLIADLPKPYQMTRASGTLFYANNESDAKKVETPSVKQRYLESSNITAVSILTEMINMMDTNRLFEANQKVITTQDSILSRTVTEMARL